MAVVEISLGEFLPAFPKPNNPGCIVADNCMPAEGGYKPFRGPQIRPGSYAGSIFSPVVGAAAVYRTDGSIVIVAGTRTQLMHQFGSVRTTTAGYNEVSDGEFWDFAQFNNFLFATSLANDPQYLTDINTDTTFSAVTGSPPRARYCERFADFLMLGCIDGAPNRIQWSAFNSPAGSWASDRLTQAGYSDLDPQFGAVAALQGGRYPMVFQERAVWVVQYVGPPTVWRLGLVSEDRGCAAPFSVVTIGGQTYFLAHDGFWTTNGSEFSPLGSRRINQWFFETVEGAYIDRTQGAVDWENKCIVWAFATPGSNGERRRMLIYSWEENRFSTATVSVDWLVTGQLEGTSLEDLDALFATLEDVTPSMDDASWKPGNRTLAAFVGDSGAYIDEDYYDPDYFESENPQSTYQTFTGPALQAEWQTGSFQPAPGQRAMLTEAQAVMEADDWTLQMAAVPADNTRAESTPAYVSPGVNGAVPLRADGKEMRLALRMPEASDWRRVAGAQVTYRASGRR